MDIDSSPPWAPAASSSGWPGASALAASTRGHYAGATTRSGHRPVHKRSRTESPERAAKRPALGQVHSLSTSHSPSGSPSPIPPIAPHPGAQIRRDSSTEFVQRTSRLGLRTPAYAEGGGTPVEMSRQQQEELQLGHPTFVDLDVAMDVEMCEDLPARPVLPIRRPSHRSLSLHASASDSHLPAYQSFSLSPGADPLSAALAGAQYYPLNRPHPAAFQQHLALSPRNASPVNGTFPTSASAPGGMAQQDRSRSPSPIVVSPPTSPKTSITMDRSRGLTGSSHTSDSSSSSHHREQRHNGFGFPTGAGAGVGSGLGARFSLGPRSDCEKCRMKVPGHYSHVIE